MTFGEKLKKIREEKGMSLSEFGDLLGTSKQVLSRYEKGENTPKISTVSKYASILGISVEYLSDDGIEDIHYTKKGSTPEMSSRTKEFAELFTRLNESQQLMVLGLLKELLAKDE